MNKNVRLVGIFDKNKPEIFDGEVMEDGDLLYKATDEVKWRPLSNDEITMIAIENQSFFQVARAIEARLKDLNT